jgi:hypothetical protein
MIGSAHAALTADEAKQLGTTLTVVGAEKAGNKDGTIPEYTGGLTTAPPGFNKAKGVRPDPFANEKPLFSIDAKNMDKYADKLSDGTKAMMKEYPSYRIDVYPTHRTAAYPKFVQEATLKNAVSAKTSPDGMSLTGAHAGVPFPIPKTGFEAMWNHLTRFTGQTIAMPRYHAYNVDAAGKVTVASEANYYQEWPYYSPAKTESDVYSKMRTFYSAPARRAGEAIMVVEPVDLSTKDRRAWQYLPGQRRVRLAPDIAYDTPNPSTAGTSTYDDTYIFNGKMDRYEFKLVGKREMYVPYNNYRVMYSDNIAAQLGPKFINPEAMRYELHRVWVVEAKLKDGKRHVYPHRVFYLDEDSWTAIASDAYDARGQLWRVGFSFIAPSYDVPAPASPATGQYDLVNGSYFVNLLPGADGMQQTDKALSDAEWSADVLAGRGIR